MSIFALGFSSNSAIAGGSSVGAFVKDKRIRGEVIYVVDGDSFVAEVEGRKVRVRLWGIDCPEHDQPGGCEAKVCINLLVKKKKIALTPKDIDKYGRLVAIAENEAGILNEKLVDLGQAWVYTYFCREPICRKWKKLESRARESRRGIWEKNDPIAPWMWKKSK